MSTYVITDLPTTEFHFSGFRASGAVGASPFSTQRFATPGGARDRTLGGALRLTRRGRLVIFALALIIVLALSVMLGGGSVATSERGEPTPTQIITVGQGVTLWAIASDIAAHTGERDVRTVMAEIESLNRLDSTMLQAGQQLRVPQPD